MHPAMWTLDRLRAAEVAVRVLLALGRVEEAEAWAKRIPAEGGGRRLVSSARSPGTPRPPSCSRRERRHARRRSRWPRPPRARRATPPCGPVAAARWPGRRLWPQAAATTRGASCGGQRPSSTRGERGATATRRCASCAVSATVRVRHRPLSPKGADRGGRLGTLTPREREVARARGHGADERADRLAAPPEREHRGEARVQGARQARPGLASRHRATAGRGRAAALTPRAGGPPTAGLDGGRGWVGTQSWWSGWRASAIPPGGHFARSSRHEPHIAFHARAGGRSRRSSRPTAPRSPSGEAATARRSCWSTAPPPITPAGHRCMPALEERFTVLAIDRRGRGRSGDATCYAIEREYEDVAAVVEWAGELGQRAGALVRRRLRARGGPAHRRHREARALRGAGRLPADPAPCRRSPPGAARRGRARRAAGALHARSRRPVRRADRAACGRCRPGRPVSPPRTRSPERSVRIGNTPSTPIASGRCTYRRCCSQAATAPTRSGRPPRRCTRPCPTASIAVMPGQRHAAMDTGTDLFLAEVLGFLAPE